MKRLLFALAATMLLASCARGGPPDPAVLQPPPSVVSTPTQPDHVTLPADDRLHNDLTEWLYYTGHLTTAGGSNYGFEFVVFQGTRAGSAPAYAAHFAVTDNNRKTFQFSQRSMLGAMPVPQSGFNIDLNGWQMQGFNGHDHLKASMDGYAMDLSLESRKPPVLHDGKGLISFGPAGDSYYYSRTRLQVTGTLTDHGTPLAVTGLAWMDHQWGNFISTGGGWDWFSIQLDGDRELMLFLLRDNAVKPAGSYGTLVDPEGNTTILAPGSYQAHSLGSWKSPESGITYPSGWQVTTPGLDLTLTPTVRDQELRTTASTGVIYWEGDVSVRGTSGGKAVTGVGYTELVGY